MSKGYTKKRQATELVAADAATASNPAVELNDTEQPQSQPPSDSSIIVPPEPPAKKARKETTKIAKASKAKVKKAAAVAIAPPAPADNDVGGDEDYYDDTGEDVIVATNAAAAAAESGGGGSGSGSAQIQRKRGRKSKKEIAKEERQRQEISFAAHTHLLNLSSVAALAPLMQIYLARPGEYELEARVGIFQQQRFVGGVTKEFFSAMLPLVNQLGSWDKASEGEDPWNRTTDIIYRNGVRKTKHWNKGVQNLLRVSYQRKERLADVDFVHLQPPPPTVAAAAAAAAAAATTTQTTTLPDLRVSLKREVTLAANDPDVLRLDQVGIECVRSKCRQSFTSQARGFRVDFTIVWTGANEEVLKHIQTRGPEAWEIELECMPSLQQQQQHPTPAALMQYTRKWFDCTQMLVGSDEPLHLFPAGLA